MREIEGGINSLREAIMLTNILVLVTNIFCTNSIDRFPVVQDKSHFVDMWSHLNHISFKPDSSQKWVQTDVWNVTIRTELTCTNYAGKIIDATSNLVSSVEQHFKRDWVADGERKDVMGSMLDAEGVRMWPMTNREVNVNGIQFMLNDGVQMLSTNKP